LNLGLTTAQASQAPNKDSGNDDDLFSHFDDIDFFEEGDGFGIDENLPPSTSIQRRPAATSIRAENPRSITTRLLVPEESIEIISFTPSQASTRSQAKNEGRGTESAEGSRQSSTTSVIDVSAELRPDDLGDLSSSASPANRVAINTAGRRQGRPIKPLPNIRKSLPTPDSSQSHRQQSQPRSQPPLGSQSKAKEVIVIGSPSPPSLPKTARTESLPRAAGYGDIEEFDSVGDLDDEEQYDKENVPVMTRHVRRKVADTEDSSFSSGLFVSSQAGQKRAGRGDVIELSDED
jgi:RecQ-mediated genome instability protein 1